jgi:predicted O-methyltransferase YrrM
MIQPPPERQTMHEYLLPLLARAIHARYYLELGLATGSSFWPVVEQQIKFFGGEAVGVDTGEVVVRAACARIYQMETDRFFAEIAPTLPYQFDLVFIDADHRYAQLCRDFEHALGVTRDHGLVCLHDTYPSDVRFTTDGYCADSYRLAAELSLPGSGWASRVEAVTLPFHPGLTIVRKRAQHLAWVPE